MLQFSENLWSGSETAERVFGIEDRGATIFPGSMIQNPEWSDQKHKNFNCCILGDATSIDGKKQQELRRTFFFERWM